MYEWNLNKIYNGFESEGFKSDIEKINKAIEGLSSVDFSKKGDLETVRTALHFMLDLEELVYNAFGYINLRMSCNSEDIEALKAYGVLDNIMTKMSEPSVKFTRYLKDFPDFMEKVKNDEELSKYEHYLQINYDDGKRLLSDETEVMLSKLDRSSGSAWGRLFDTLTSTVEVDYDGKKINLPGVRNLAYSEDGKVRKAAYEAELKCYKQIDKSIAACLSSIKQEVTTLCEARGFKDSLEKTLEQTGMTRKTLDALTGAIEEYYPYFRAYLKRKGEMFGDKNGCPFYDLFAPVGKASKTFTVEEANKYLIDRFSKFNPEISIMVEKAMSNEWIDYMPRMGKVGGAFCEGVFKVKESRILTNFDGSLDSVITLAHELGHAYHNEVMWDYPIVYSNYPMQLAETASTFNETYIKDDAMKNAKDKDELLFILEKSIADDTQVIVDIMSRFYFEKSVFEESNNGALTPDELCELMKKAQLKSYGDGLDKDYLHPYMWCCKGHYYSTGLSFYNFPYAFGQLFAYGLYSIYEEQGDSFFPLYKKVLQTAGRMPIKECVLQAGIDTEDINFWKKSLDLVKAKIEQFLELTK